MLNPFEKILLQEGGMEEVIQMTLLLGTGEAYPSSALHLLPAPSVVQLCDTSRWSHRAVASWSLGFQAGTQAMDLCHGSLGSFDKLKM